MWSCSPSSCITQGKLALPDTELDKLGDFFSDVPASAASEAIPSAGTPLIMVCEPVWQLISPAGTVTRVYWGPRGDQPCCRVFRADLTALHLYSPFGNCRAVSSNSSSSSSSSSVLSSLSTLVPAGKTQQHASAEESIQQAWMQGGQGSSSLNCQSSQVGWTVVKNPIWLYLSSPSYSHSENGRPCSSFWQKDFASELV